MRGSYTGAGILVATAFCFTASAAVARPPRADVENSLTGGQARDWIRSREKIFMGSGGCESGERWRFMGGGVLKIRTCVQGQWRTATHRWSLQPDGDLDWKLVATPARPENGRRVRFKSNSTMLVLRKMPGSKISGIEDLELALAQGSAPSF